MLSTLVRALRAVVLVVFVLLGAAVLLGALNAAPASAQNASATMDCWSPAATTLGICGAGSPDVRVNQSVTLKAHVDTCSIFCIGYTDVGNAPYRVDWDKDANGTVDFTQANVSIGGSFQWATSYAAAGAYRPQFRVCGSSGCTGFDKYDVVLVQYDLDVQSVPPNATMHFWSPCFTTLGLCSGGSPDGRPSNNFTFSAVSVPAARP